MNPVHDICGYEVWAPPASWIVRCIVSTDTAPWGEKLARGVLISIVEDDPAVRKSLERLIKSVGLLAQAFASAEEFLKSGDHVKTACLILDVRLPGMNGLELQRQLADAPRQIPIIFVSAHDDRQARNQALARGAVAFLGKPFSEDALLDAVHSVLD